MHGILMHWDLRIMHGAEQALSTSCAHEWLKQVAGHMHAARAVRAPRQKRAWECNQGRQVDMNTMMCSSPESWPGHPLSWAQ